MSRSPATGVQYLNQFAKNFLRPYRRQENPRNEETVFRCIKPESCEWPLRPKIAASELSDTIIQNLEKLDELSGGTLLRPSSLVKFKDIFHDVEDHLTLFNRKDIGEP